MLSLYKLLIPVEWPTRGNEDVQIALFNDLANISGKIPFITIGTTKYSPEISIVDEYTTHLQSQVLTPVPAIEMRIELPQFYSKPNFESPYDLEFNHDLSANNDHNSMIYANYLFTAMDQVRIIFDQTYYFICMSQIAYPGSLATYAWEIFVDGKYNDSFDVYDSLMARLAVRHEYPNLQKLQLTHVWTWFESNKLYLKGFSTSSVSRAFNGITYLHNHSYGNINHTLMWSLFCLEALFVEANATGITKKLEKRINKILGRPEKLHNAIRNLYDFRSRFVHGDFNIRRYESDPFFFKEEIINDNGYYLKLNANGLLAVELLYTTMQWLILNNRNNTGFCIDREK